MPKRGAKGPSGSGPDPKRVGPDVEASGSTNSAASLLARIKELETTVRDLKLANQVLQATEREFRLLADNMPAYFAYIDSSHRYRFVNRQHERIFKVPGASVLGKHVKEVLGKDAYEALKDYMEAALKGKRVSFEMPAEPLAAGPRWIAATLYPDCDETGRCTGFYALVVDITEMKRSDLALRREKARAQKYLDLVGVIVVAIDTKGKVMLINRKGCEILGYREEEILGKSWITNFLPKRLRKRVNTYRKQLLAGEVESIDYFENPVVTKSGEERVISWSNIVLRDDEGRITSTLSAGSDITEHIRAEERLKASMQELDRQRKALEDKNIALRELLGQVELEKTRMKEDVAATVSEAVLPLLTKMRLKGASRKYISLVERYLNDLASPYARKITRRSLRLTPREIEICDMLKGGLSSKEMAELLGISLETVEKHRHHIRKKLGISKKNINLASYLQSL
jgi:PAS domain S-box-containing protein